MSTSICTNPIALGSQSNMWAMAMGRVWCGTSGWTMLEQERLFNGTAKSDSHGFREVGGTKDNEQG